MWWRPKIYRWSISFNFYLLFTKARAEALEIPRETAEDNSLSLPNTSKYQILGSTVRGLEALAGKTTSENKRKLIRIGDATVEREWFFQCFPTFFQSIPSSWCQDFALVRLACLARVQDSKAYVQLRAAWDGLGSERWYDCYLKMNVQEWNYKDIDCLVVSHKFNFDLSWLAGRKWKQHLTYHKICRVRISTCCDGRFDGTCRYSRERPAHGSFPCRWHGTEDLCFGVLTCLRECLRKMRGKREGTCTW